MGEHDQNGIPVKTLHGIRAKTVAEFVRDAFTGVIDLSCPDVATLGLSHMQEYINEPVEQMLCPRPQGSVVPPVFIGSRQINAGLPRSNGCDDPENNSRGGRLRRSQEREFGDGRRSATLREATCSQS